ncbi:LOB domain-containing protein 24-like [Herrania umbratica]|uniref:LOB domain-containing protein 24-like n=1 Tax=Herrania umbratica TaxID=108875 RepID=A0A6J1ADX0_9ROSI|nr:LOB domain-containing protein 24-like [Herrania umbratica]XP_021284859.1 LOB domain-containing protein 24-like [Herrania umbratica]XP_021284866.1 LOB domain-containing protein 24-like [Herrania umbratica]XP_021284877.1 LOB domain-containing protein 24-like [Herrania umbratica]
MNPGRCAACKYLRRKCPSDCVFSPYFPSNNLQRFASIHKIYGASNVAKLLQQLPVHHRAQAVDSLFFEAHCRIEAPVYGCVGLVFTVQQQIHDAATQLAKTRAKVAVLKSTAHHSQIQSDSNVFLPGPQSVAHLGLFNQASFGFI